MTILTVRSQMQRHLLKASKNKSSNYKYLEYNAKACISAVKSDIQAFVLLLIYGENIRKQVLMDQSKSTLGVIVIRRFHAAVFHLLATRHCHRGHALILYILIPKVFADSFEFPFRNTEARQRSVYFQAANDRATYHLMRLLGATALYPCA